MDYEICFIHKGGAHEIELFPKRDLTFPCFIHAIRVIFTGGFSTCFFLSFRIPRFARHGYGHGQCLPYHISWALITLVWASEKNRFTGHYERMNLSVIFPPNDTLFRPACTMMASMTPPLVASVTPAVHVNGIIFAVISNRVIFRVNVGFTYEADGISAMQCYAAIR